MGVHSEARLDVKMLGLIKQINLYLNHFPRHEKYGLSQQIRNCAYDAYALIIECQKRYHKKTTLTSLDIRHEQLRMFIRLAFELGYFAFRNSAIDDDQPALLAQKRYHTLSVMVDEVGRMIGGWIREDRAEKPA